MSLRPRSGPLPMPDRLSKAGPPTPMVMCSSARSSGRVNGEKAVDRRNSLVGESDRGPLGAFDHVIVRGHQSFRIYDEAAALRLVVQRDGHDAGIDFGHQRREVALVLAACAGRQNRRQRKSGNRQERRAIRRLCPDRHEEPPPVKRTITPPTTYVPSLADLKLVSMPPATTVSHTRRIS